MSRQSTQPVQFPLEDFLKTWLYLPITTWQETFEDFFHPQVFFGCNIEDMDDEYQVLNEVGSYGKQISQILKVLDIFLAHPPANLSQEERIALEQFRAYQARVAAALKKSRGPQAADLTLGYVDRLGDALAAKQQTDKEDFTRILEKLLIVAGRYTETEKRDQVSASMN